MIKCIFQRFFFRRGPKKVVIAAKPLRALKVEDVCLSGEFKNPQGWFVPFLFPEKLPSGEFRKKSLVMLIIFPLHITKRDNLIYVLLQGTEAA